MTIGFLIPLLVFGGVLTFLAYIQVIKPLLDQHRKRQETQQLFRQLVGAEPSPQDWHLRVQIQAKVHCRMGMYAIHMYVLRTKIAELRPCMKHETNPNYHETQERILSLQKRLKQVEDKARLLREVAVTFLYVTYQLDDYVQNTRRLSKIKKQKNAAARRRARDQRRAAALTEQEQPAPPASVAPAEPAPTAEPRPVQTVEIPAPPVAETPASAQGEAQIVH